MISLIVGALVLIALTIGIIVCGIIVRACFNGGMNIVDLSCECIVIFCLLAELIAISLNGEEIYRACVAVLAMNTLIFIVELIQIILNIFFIDGEE